MVAYVTGGVLLGALGWYAPLVNFAGCGAAVPLSGFRISFKRGCKSRRKKKKGILGVFTGGITAGAAGIAAAVFFSCLMAAIAKPKENRKKQAPQRTETLRRLLMVRKKEFCLTARIPFSSFSSTGFFEADEDKLIFLRS